MISAVAAVAALPSAVLRSALGRVFPLLAAFARERQRGATGARAGARRGAGPDTATPTLRPPVEPEPANRRELADSDARLFARVAEGDPAALADVYDRYARFVYSLLLRQLRDRGEAEDALQDVFLKAWGRAEQFDPRRGTALSWLGTLARNHAIDRARAAGVRPRPAAGADPDAEDDAAAPDDARRRPEAKTVLEEDRAAVRGGLEALPAEQRILLELAYFDGLSQSEIAEHVSAPLGTVKTRMRAGLRALREALAVRFAGEGADAEGGGRP